MTQILWQLTMALAFQVSVGMVPNAGVDLKKSRHLSEKKHEEKTAPDWQAWMWASMALGAAGAMGACGAWRFVRKQRQQSRELLPDNDDVCEDDDEREVNSISFLDILQRHKTVLLLKGVAGIGFRSVDFGLDVRTGTKFYADGDVWWCGILSAVILVSPLPQYLYIKYQRGTAADALAYLIPGSVKHLQREITNMRFIAKLPQISLYRNVHKAVATGTLNEILAGWECACESLPQAILQLRAYAVKGGDWVNRLSIAFSLLGVAIGVVLGVKAILTQKKQKSLDVGDAAVELALNAGQCVDLQECPMDDQTADAVLWLAEHDRDLCTWNWSKCPGMNDALMIRFAHKCPHLAEIYLKFCDLTDDGIQEMAHGCKDLTMVNLYECKAITDASVKELAKKCTGITNINLGYSKKITDDAVKELAKNCKNLTIINLAGCNSITDDAVMDLAVTCNGLTTILLTETKVTDVGVKELARHCKELTTINLWGCDKITDDGVKELAERCPNLTKISIGETPAYQSKDQLAKKYPHISFEYD